MNGSTLVGHYPVEGYQTPVKTMQVAEYQVSDIYIYTYNTVQIKAVQTFI